jgi:hypothetical protein
MNPQIHALVDQGILKIAPFRPRAGPPGAAKPAGGAAPPRPA